MKLHKFEDMHVWQEARMLTKIIRAICKRQSVYRDFSFTDQITRAARSIGANIAEGAEAMTIPEYIQFLGYAKRSAGEVRAHLFDALDDSYISEKEFEDIADKTRKIGSMLAKLIHHLQDLNPDLKRTFRARS